jgi:hypothetical protein
MASVGLCAPCRFKMLQRQEETEATCKYETETAEAVDEA